MAAEAKLVVEVFREVLLEEEVFFRTRACVSVASAMERVGASLMSTRMEGPDMTWEGRVERLKEI
jgi:hypothetical protein